MGSNCDGQVLSINDQLSALEAESSDIEKQYKEAQDLSRECTKGPSAVQILAQRMTALTTMQLTLYPKYRELHRRIVDDELGIWKRAQQMAGNGFPFDDNLDQIEFW